MSSAMDCRRAEELLSDHRDKSLNEVLAAELDRHLAACESCRSLRRALDEVMDALAGYPVMEPPADLAARAAAAALAAPAPPRVAPRRTEFLPPRQRAWMQAAAAVVLLAAGIVLLASGPEAAPARAADRLIERTSNAAAYVAERKDRLLEDVRILRVVIEAAFEGRLDRVSDRIADYRRRLEKRRADESQKHSGSGVPAGREERLSNSADAGLVRPCGDARWRAWSL